MQGGARSPAASLRWWQLVFGVVCMMPIALQYGWTLFVQPIRQAQGLVGGRDPVGGWLADALGPRRGPKLTVALGGVLVGVAWMVNAYAASLAMPYPGAVVSGVGAGLIYATCVGNPAISLEVHKT